MKNPLVIGSPGMFRRLFQQGVEFLGCAVLVMGLLSTSLCAQSDSAGKNVAKPAGEGLPPVKLSDDQEILASRYSRFETTLTQLADLLKKTDPVRAELLVRAIGKSKEGRVPDQMRELVEVLKREQLGDALDRQEMVIEQMQALLELLMSEDRKDEIRKEMERIKGLIKDLDQVIGKEKDVRADTERGEDPRHLEQSQKRVADSAKKLMDKIDGQDAAKNASRGSNSKPDDTAKPGESKTGKPGDSKDDKNKDDQHKEGKTDPAEKKDRDQKPGEKKEGDSKPGEQKTGEQKPGEKNDSPPQDGKNGKPGQPGQSSPKPPMPNSSDQKNDDGDQQAQKPQQPQPPQDQQKKYQTPGRKEIEQARDEMERAIQELKKKNLNKASDKQDQALAELIKAKEKLEEILRQLREEERDLLLMALEARFRDMLARQLVVYNGTVAIHTVPVSQRIDRHRNRSVELSRQEDEIAVDAAKALTLLKEEGSSIAFPEAVEEVRDDMLNVARRLERFDVAEMTQGLERDIIETLEEIIEALRKEIEKSKDKKQGQKPPGQPSDPALVDQLAELKLLRSLQYRINRRTKRLGQMVEGEQAVQDDVLNQLRELSGRQSKLQRATYDLATGKNK